MKPRFLFYVLMLSLLGLSAASAADWVPFFKHLQNNTVWVYDREGVVFSKDKEILGLFNMKDKNFPKVWFKSVQPGKERRLLVELDCRGRTGRLSDETGNDVYADKEVDFMFGHQFRPDSVMEALHEEVCLSKMERDKGGKESASPADQ